MDIKNLNIAVTEEEYDALCKAKGDRNWHDFLMLLINIKLSKNGDKKVG